MRKATNNNNNNNNKKKKKQHERGKTMSAIARNFDVHQTHDAVLGTNRCRKSEGVCIAERLVRRIVST